MNHGRAYPFIRASLWPLHTALNERPDDFRHGCKVTSPDSVRYSVMRVKLSASDRLPIDPPIVLPAKEALDPPGELGAGRGAKGLPARKAGEMSDLNREPRPSSFNPAGPLGLKS